MQAKPTLTTGEVAKFCGVNFRTVIRWIERGHLEAYKLPGRGDNRIPLENFLAFLEANEMPVPEGLALSQRCLLICLDQSANVAELAACGRRAEWDVVIAQDSLSFGFLLASRQPRAIIINNLAWQESIERLQREMEYSECLLIGLNQQLAEPRKGWHSIVWPNQQQALADLLQND